MKKIFIFLFLQIFLVNCTTFNIKKTEKVKIKLNSDANYTFKISYESKDSKGNKIPKKVIEIDYAISYLRKKYPNVNMQFADDCLKNTECFALSIIDTPHCGKDCRGTVWSISLMSLGLLPTWMRSETEIIVKRVGSTDEWNVKFDYLLLLHIFVSPAALFRTPKETDVVAYRQSLDQIFE